MTSMKWQMLRLYDKYNLFAVCCIFNYHSTFIHSCLHSSWWMYNQLIYHDIYFELWYIVWVSYTKGVVIISSLIVRQSKRIKEVSPKSIYPMLTEKIPPHVHHITKKRNGSIIFWDFSIVENTWDGKFSYCHIFSFVVTGNLVFRVFVEFKPCLKEMVTKMYVLCVTHSLY